jgi:hypothetical protein
MKPLALLADAHAPGRGKTIRMWLPRRLITGGMFRQTAFRTPAGVLAAASARVLAVALAGERR